ncbi:MAG: DinB family protein [Cyclobacteriaceae bacterium]|nr:DinB family protein [Cyclobacteriaceae bacterium HetDA_MAG_MS6]
MKFSLQETISILERTPSVLEAYLKDLSPAWTLQTEGPNTWSAFDVLGHLIHGEQTDWIPRAKIILSQSESKKFEPFDRFAQFEESKGKTMDQLLQEFNLLRKQNIEVLKSMNLGERQLSLIGIHPEFGEITLRQLLAAWTVHDLGHIAQISRVAAKQYKEAVGPWTAYLTILN